MKIFIHYVESNRLFRINILKHQSYSSLKNKIIKLGLKKKIFFENLVNIKIRYINKYLSKQNTKNKRYKVGRIFKKSFKLASNYHTLKVLEKNTFITNSKVRNYNQKKKVQLTVHDQEDSVLQIVTVDFHLDVLHHTLEATRDIKSNELFFFG